MTDLPDYRYDKRGNQIEELCSNEVIKNYTYDATNHMVLGRNLENGEKSEYVYNGFFMRVKNVQTLEQRTNVTDRMNTGGHRQT